MLTPRRLDNDLGRASDGHPRGRAASIAARIRTAHAARAIGETDARGKQNADGNETAKHG